MKHNRGPNMCALITATPAGACPFCRFPMERYRNGRRSLHCGNKVCRAGYQKVYARDRRLREAGVNFTGTRNGKTPARKVDGAEAQLKRPQVDSRKGRR